MSLKRVGRYLLRYPRLEYWHGGGILLEVSFVAVFVVAIRQDVASFMGAHVPSDGGAIKSASKP